MKGSLSKQNLELLDRTSTFYITSRGLTAVGLHSPVSGEKNCMFINGSDGGCVIMCILLLLDGRLTPSGDNYTMG